MCLSDLQVEEMRARLLAEQQKPAAEMQQKVKLPPRPQLSREDAEFIQQLMGGKL